jgi:hypothetical protein
MATSVFARREWIAYETERRRKTGMCRSLVWRGSLRKPFRSFWLG